MFELRPYQDKLKQDVYASVNAGSKATIAVLPTGGGKTPVMASMAYDFNDITCAMAHRAELGQQISMAMATMRLPHNIIAPQTVINAIIQLHIETFGRSFYDPKSKLTVCGVNTLNARASDLTQWANTVRWWFGDECHHFLRDNQWGRAVAMFTNAVGVGFTATPIRCDNKSLYVGQQGVFHDMCVGPSMRDLIDMGFLSDYRIYGPTKSIDLAKVKVSKATGDYSRPSLVEAAQESTITGDIVDHYTKLAFGKRGLTFVTDVEMAMKVAGAFQQAGIPAAAISAKTPDAVRNDLVKQFRAGSIRQLVNVDLFGEGFDVPKCEVISMGRPTQSFPLYAQQFGRPLRLDDDKEYGLIIDHVGNVEHHLPADAERTWTLIAEESGKRRAKDDDDVIPVTTCVKCFRVYENLGPTCPHCGYRAEPESRGEPKFVAGDLQEFSPELLAELRTSIAKVEGDVRVPLHLQGTPAAGAIARQHGERQMALDDLKDTIAQWAGVRRDKDMSDSEIHRRFFHMFKVDVMSAQALKTAEMTALSERVKKRYWK